MMGLLFPLARPAQSPGRHPNWRGTTLLRWRGSGRCGFEPHVFRVNEPRLVIKKRLAPDELWPLWSLDDDGDDVVEVTEEQVARWTQVMREFKEVQKEMQDAVDRARPTR